MADAELSKALKAVKAKGQRFALIVGKKKNKVLVSAKAYDKALLEKAEEECDGKLAVKGICKLEADGLAFVTKSKPTPDWTKKISKCVKESPFSKTVAMRQLGKDEPEDVTGEVGQEETPKEEVNHEQEFGNRLKELAPKYTKAVGTKGGIHLKGLFIQAKGTAEKGEFAAACEMLDEMELEIAKALGELGGAKKPAPPRELDEDALKKRQERATKKVMDQLREEDDEGPGEAMEEMFANEEDVARHKEEEKKAFAKFSDEFNTFRDVGTIQTTEQERKAMQKAVERALRRAESRREELKRNGQVPDLDELAKEFEHIPRNFMPIQFKKELQDWRMVRDAMLDRNVRKMFEGTDFLESGKSGLEVFSTVVTISEGVTETFFDGKKAELAATVMKDLGFGVEALGGIVGTVKGLKGMSESEGPVQKKMSSDETLEGLTKLVSTGMDIGTEFVPLLGAVKEGATCINNIKECYEHFKLKAETGELKDEAQLLVMSQLSKAFGQEEDRRGTLGKKAVVDTVGSGISTVGKTLTSTGIGAKVGVPLQVVGKVITIGNTVYFKNVDWTQAAKAQEVLSRARAGDEEAMQTVFADHCTYAKMLIALYAKNKHPLAIKYFVQRGLTEEDLNHPATSMDILMEFGLKQSQEEEEPKTFSQTLSEGLGKVVGLADSIRKGVGSLLVKVGLMKETPPEKLANNLPDVNIKRVYTIPQMEAMIKMLEKCRKTRDLVVKAGGTVPEVTLRNITSLESSLKGMRDDTLQLYTKLLEEKSRLDIIRVKWEREVEEIETGRRKPFIEAMNPKPLVPIVIGFLSELQEQIEHGKAVFEVITRIPLD